MQTIVIILKAKKEKKKTKQHISIKSTSTSHSSFLVDKLCTEREKKNSFFVFDKDECIKIVEVRKMIIFRLLICV